MQPDALRCLAHLTILSCSASRLCFRRSTGTGSNASCYSARARGEARADSDYDIAVFFRDLPDVWKERLRLADLRVDFLDTTGAFFDAKRDGLDV
jgi:hypothetical protein